MPLPPRRVLRTFKYAMYFDGRGGYVSIPSWLNNLMGKEWTVEVWVNTIVFVRQVGLANLFSSYSYNYFGWGLLHETSLNRLVFMTFYSGGNNYITLVGWNAYFGSWRHVVGRYSESLNDQSLFLDASLKGSVSPKPMVASPYNPVIGGDIVVQYISIARVYSKPLSASEIKWNYQYPDNPVRDGLVLWLKADPQYIRDIDGDGVLEWVDLSGYGNHGKIYGAQLVELVKTPSRVLKPAVRILKPAR